MRRWLGIAVLAGLAVAAQAAVFERFLSPDRPADRAILAYLALDKNGQATSTDLAELAVLLVNKGFPKDAETYLRAALKKDKHNHEAAFRLGLVLQRQGRHAAACRYYRRTLKERPGHGPARFMLALAEERAGRTRAAIRDYARAYRHAPDLADPAKNPLVLDSHLQTLALIEHYRDTVNRATYHVWPIDSKAVQQMMLARPAPVPQGPVAVPETPPPAPPRSPAAAAPPGRVPAPAAELAPRLVATPAPGAPGGGELAPSNPRPARGSSAAPPVLLPFPNASAAP